MKSNSQKSKIVIFGIALAPTAHLEVSIDNTVWKIGSKFLGFKEVPCGFHIISVEKSDCEPLLLFSDNNHTQIVNLENNRKLTSMDEQDKMYTQLKDLAAENSIDPAMVKYQVENYDVWNKNTDCIAIDIVKMIKDIPQGEEFEFPDIKAFQTNFYRNLDSKDITTNKRDMTKLLHYVIYYETKFCEGSGIEILTSFEDSKNKELNLDFSPMQKQSDESFLIKTFSKVKIEADANGDESKDQLDTLQIQTENVEIQNSLQSIYMLLIIIKIQIIFMIKLFISSNS